MECRDPATTRTDDDGIMREQPLDGTDLADTLGYGRRHDPAPRVAIGLDYPALGRREISRFLRIVYWPDKFSGVLEGGIMRIDLHSGEEGGDGHVGRQHVA